MRAFCPSLESTVTDLLGILVGCVHSYQSLIAGVLAIIAALLAAKPVWRQLKTINFQSQKTQRDLLDARFRESTAAFQRFQAEVESQLSILMPATHDPGGNPQSINEHTSHGLLQTMQRKSDWYYADHHGIESATVLNARNEMQEAKQNLERTLTDAHFTAAYDQSGEDYSYSDVEWAALGAKAERACINAASKTSNYAAAWTAFRQIHLSWQKEIASRIASMDASLTKHQF